MMKKVLLFFGMIAFSLIAPAQKKWQKEGVKLPPPVCYASKSVNKSFIAPPDKFLKRLKSSEVKTAQIIVTYIGFPNTQKAAFQHAVDIWEYLINSPVPIYMTAIWSSLDTDVLGSCAPFEYYENFESAPLKNHYYPVALAEKMEGKEITGSSVPDLVASFNKDITEWYYGTDGNTPTNKYDFVSIVMHEIAHGLGFTGFFYEHDNVGAYGSTFDFPGVFDEYVINYSEQQLTDTSLFSNHSVELLDELTSGYVLFKSETAKANSSNDKYPRLYAPATYDEGSSIYHLNETTYPAENANSLMTPYAGKGEAIHDPGPHVLGIFADMGWVYTSISHDELRDMETVEAPIEVRANITSDTELDSTSLMVVYSTSTFDESVDTLHLTYSAEIHSFTTTFPDFDNGKINYYLAASDTSGRIFRLPAKAPSEYFDFIIGPDTIPPVITHTPVKFMLESDQSADIEAGVTDNIAVESVVVEYKINDQAFEKLILATAGDDSFTGQFNFDGLTDGDSISYRIVATDGSSNANTDTIPTNGFYTFFIDGVYDPVSSYTNDFNTVSHDFISSDFYIATENFFDDGALNSPHPYPSPELDDTNYEFTTMLKYPIILNQNKKMIFNEVVLVEPGESGTQYGDDEFWDYVIVEGSKNGTDTWLPLIDGYDSGANTSWLQEYNNSVSGNNSSAVGTKELYIKREFSLLQNGNFNVGDTIFIRFRLFSDPYAHGWGWIIDDLAVQDPPTGIIEAEVSPGDLAIFPNPATDQLTIRGKFNHQVESLNLSLLSSTGNVILEKELRPNANQISEIIDIRQLNPGLYLVRFSFQNGQVITRKLIKQ